VHAFFERQQQQWETRDPEALAGGHASDGTIVSPIFRTVRGQREILESYHALFATFPDWRYVATDLLIDSDRVAQPFTVSATHVGEFMGIAGTGRKFEFDGIRLFEMRDGLIAQERRFYDFTALLMQLGVLRAKPAKPQ
jgi:predicted ester cyclase